MTTTSKQNRLLSHQISPKNIEATVRLIKERIQQAGEKEYTSISQQLELLDQLTQFDFGRFLLQNQGVNGYWTHYMLTHPWFGRKTRKNNRGEPLSKIEQFILERAPTMLATQERFEIFLRENQQAIHNNAKLACIPSGMMGELLYLDFKGIEHINLVGIDYDPHTLIDAKALAKQQDLAQFVTLTQADAWQLNFEREFDLISSNGLNIYEPDDNKVCELYTQFYQALKPGGKLVTSFLTLPPMLTDQCEWNLNMLNSKDLLLQRILFADIINAKFQCFRSTEKTKAQLEAAGFNHIQFIYDKAKIFPTVTALS